MSQVLDSISRPSLVKLLLAGKIGVLPTDTVYGLVCSAHSETAVARLYGLKNRHKKPGTLVAANITQLLSLGFSKKELDVALIFWPASLSIILPLPTGEYSYLMQEVGDIAVRIPNNLPLQELLEKTGPLLTTSANLPREQPAATVQEAIDYFGDKLDFYVDGGTLSSPPSTIIKIIDGKTVVLRQGAAKIQ